MDAILNMTPLSLEVSLIEEDAVEPANITTPPEPSVPSQPSINRSIFAMFHSCIHLSLQLFYILHSFTPYVKTLIFISYHMI